MLRVVQKHKAFLLFLFVAPFFVAAPTYAEDVDYNINVIPSINITVPEGDIVLNVNPSSQPFDSGSTRILVSTNSPAGYQLVMTADGSDLVKTDNEHIVIPTLPAHEGGYTESSFVDNKWGYGIDGGNYLPFVPDTLIKETDTMANEDPTDFSVAAKVDFTQTDGTYRTTITFVAVANIIYPYIQDIDSNYCSSSPTIVLDSRDDQEYIIQKLEDGTCWMMNNLNLGAVSLKTGINSDNTNYPKNVSVEEFNEWKDRNVYPVEGADPVAHTPYGALYWSPTIEYGNGAPDIITYDICPAGWRLPTVGEFRNTYNEHANSSVDKMRAPISAGGMAIPLGGVLSRRDSTPDLGHTALYYTRELIFSGDMVEEARLNIDNGKFDVAGGMGMPLGSYAMSIRCVQDTKKVQITFHTNNAEGIEFNWEFYEDGQTAQVDPGTYPLVGRYGVGRTFQSWSATAGTISNADYVDYNVNTYTVTDDATITLTGQTPTVALQDVTASTCTSTPMPTYDNRDNQVYWIKRLNDGNCWMLDNLNLGATDLTTDLTSSNTNLENNISSSTFNGWSTQEHNALLDTSASFIPITREDDPSTSTTQYYPNGKIGISTSTPQYPNWKMDHVTGTYIGSYYNICAVSAGTSCATISDEGINYDICPKGWRLPTASISGAGEINNLIGTYTPTTLRSPISDGGVGIVLGGYVYPDGHRWPLNHIYSVYWTSSRTDVGEATVWELSYFDNGKYNFIEAKPDNMSAFFARCILK